MSASSTSEEATEVAAEVAAWSKEVAGWTVVFLETIFSSAGPVIEMVGSEGSRSDFTGCDLEIVTPVNEG